MNLNLQSVLKSFDLTHNLEPLTEPTPPSSSVVFRRTGRETKAPWSNRFKKETFDLHYDVNYSQIKGMSSLNSQEKNRKKSFSLSNLQTSCDIRMSTGMSNVSKSSFTKHKERIEKIKINRFANPEKIHVNEKQIEDREALGLSKFEFERTIEGRLKEKSSKSVQFEHQTSRPININKVWAAESEKVDKTSEFIKKKRSNRSHSFTSYTNRKIFESKDKLDKFYDTEKGERLTCARSMTKPIKFAEFREEKSKLLFNTIFSYNEHEAKNKTMLKICSFSISNSKKELKFNRQVISAQRGCYR